MLLFIKKQKFMKHRRAVIQNTSYARMKRSGAPRHKAKHTPNSPCGEATLHRAKPLLHAPKSALHQRGCVINLALKKNCYAILSFEQQ